MNQNGTLLSIFFVTFNVGQQKSGPPQPVGGGGGGCGDCWPDEGHQFLRRYFS